MVRVKTISSSGGSDFVNEANELYSQAEKHVADNTLLILSFSVSSQYRYCYYYIFELLPEPKNPIYRPTDFLFSLVLTNLCYLRFIEQSTTPPRCQWNIYESDGAYAADCHEHF